MCVQSTMAAIGGPPVRLFIALIILTLFFVQFRFVVQYMFDFFVSVNYAALFNYIGTPRPFVLSKIAFVFNNVFIFDVFSFDVFIFSDINYWNGTHHFCP